MSTKALIALVLALVIAVLASQTLYTVHQTERAILLEFGNLVEDDPYALEVTDRARCEEV